MSKQIPIIPLPSYEYLHECFEFYGNSKLLIWKQRPMHHFKNIEEYCDVNDCYAGTRVGYAKPNGYMEVLIGTKTHNLARIVFKLKTGKDSVPLAIYIAEKEKPKHIIKYKGVSFNKASGKFIAYMHVEGEHIYLGSFYTAQEAREECQHNWSIYRKILENKTRDVIFRGTAPYNGTYIPKTQYSTLNTQHSTLNTQHSTLYTQYPTHS